MTLAEYQKLVRQRDEYREELARAEGSFDEIAKGLKKDYGVSSLKEAEALLTKLEREEKKLDDEVQAALRKFEKKYGDKL